MTIRYTPDLSARMNKAVKRYNEKVRRAHNLGGIAWKDLPEVASVKNLKKNYSTRRELERELSNLEMFGRKSIRRGKLFEEGKISQYDLKLLKANRAAAINYYQNIVDVLEPRVKQGYVGEKQRINNSKEYIKLLVAPINELNYQQLRSAIAGVETYRASHAVRAGGYRGFLSEVEYVMSQVGVPEEVQNEFFKKLSKLDENDFFELYSENDLIQRVYDIADSPTLGKGIKMNLSKKEAKKKIQELLTNIDFMIEKQQKKHR